MGILQSLCSHHYCSANIHNWTLAPIDYLSGWRPSPTNLLLFSPQTDWQLTNSESELLYNWLLTTNQFVLAPSLLRLTTSYFFFQLNPCSHSPFETSSLTRVWVCRLQLLPVLASAVILRCVSRRTQDHILLSQIRDSPNLEGQVPVFISPRNRVVHLYSQALGSLFVASCDSQGTVSPTFF
jgi:hypothetical protein